MFRATCLVAIAFAITACSQSDAVGNVNGPPVIDAGRGAAAAPFVRVDLGTLGGASSYAAAINNAGVVVGWSETKTGDTHAFRWTPAEGMVDLGTLPGDRNSEAVAILDGSTSDSQILGTSGRDVVVWSASASVAVLPLPPISDGSFAYPQGFNQRGEVVGFASGATLTQQAWMWSARDGKTDLSTAVQPASNEGSASAITSDGVALLTAQASTCKANTQCWRTFLWSRGSGFLALGVPDNNSEASVTGLALNDDRTVVGWTERSNGVAPYRWSAKDGFAILPNYSSSAYAYAAGVNASGYTVGAALEPTSGSIVATAWPASGGILRLSPDDPSPSVALAINRSGTVAGWASVAGGVNHATIWMPSTQLTRPTGDLVASQDASPRPNRSDMVSSASDGCLTQMHSLGSRQGLFACVKAADRARRARRN